MSRNPRGVTALTAPPTVALFDIDGTLTRGNGAGARSLAIVLDRLFGRPDAIETVTFHGGTDRALARELLQAVGAPADDAAIDHLIAAYLEVFPGQVAPGDYRPQAGAVALLDALTTHRQVALGLGTGNIEPAGRLKLASAGIEHYFAFGGFGSDAEVRAEIVAIGAQRGAERLGVPRERCRVVVIGDTTKDVAAAHAIGAECLAVATGGATVAQLEDARATVVVSSLERPEAWRFLGLAGGSS